MKIYSEALRLAGVALVTVLVISLLWTVPWFLIAFLLIPLAMSWWFWPHSSTLLAYFVGAIIGLLFTAWAFVGAVAQPEGFPTQFIWLPLVWGPAGVIVKRLELIVVEAHGRRKRPKGPLPKI